MRVVGAILDSRGMGWEDSSRAVAYFRNMDHLPLLARYCEERGLPPLPVAVAHADICREELLFEIELDAVKARD
jgi:hypothetical protein